MKRIYCLRCGERPITREGECCERCEIEHYDSSIVKLSSERHFGTVIPFHADEWNGTNDNIIHMIEGVNG